MPDLLTSWLYYAVWAGGRAGQGCWQNICQPALCRHPGSLEAVLADLKASGQPLEAARGLMQVVELSNDN